MRNPPVPYKHAGAIDQNYGKSGDSSLLAKRRQNFAEGGAIQKLDALATSQDNPSVAAVKAIVSSQNLDKPSDTNAAFKDEVKSKYKEMKARNDATRGLGGQLNNLGEYSNMRRWT